MLCVATKVYLFEVYLLSADVQDYPIYWIICVNFKSGVTRE